jgi:5-histidylcysteine sulfoxide synthase/putative 4-mercaptohistidine N1-methyltranferase
MSFQVMATPRLDQGDPELLRDEILRYFHDCWNVYEGLFEVMANDEAYFTRADPLRHPLIFYLGHTATFFLNKMVLAKIITERVDPHLESIFAIGVDEMSWDDLNDANYNWPTVAETWEYREKVRAVVENAIAELPLTMPVSWDDPFWMIMMGIEHERIHLETSSVLIRQLPLAMIRPSDNWKICDRSGEAPANDMVPVSGGTVLQGQSDNHGYYGWDNEYGRLETEVRNFSASRYLVSNGEFKEFVDNGGYSTEKWWTEEGWAWRTYRRAECPTFWVKSDTGMFSLRCLTEEIPMPWDWPVEVNYLEAKAFCNWKAEVSGKPVRLPTEAEWHRLLGEAGLAGKDNWTGVDANINLSRFASSCPVTDHRHGDFFDVVGNVWQWTETPISGFPGFKVHPLYDDFSTPTFDTRHTLIKGGSWISTGNEATPFSRYAFRRHFFQHAGFRYIESDAKVEIRQDIYETDELIGQYCEFHYGDDYYGVRNFPLAAAEICGELMKGRTFKRALDLGCATGRSTFELARFCDRAIGIDFSARFIRVGHEMQQTGRIRYAIKSEGELVSYKEKTLTQFGLDQVQDKVEFWQGDAHNLKPQFTDFDLVLACNLVDRLSQPAKFLAHITERINKGGLLVILSPYTWLEEFTAKENWLGGKKVDGENVTTLEGLQRELEPRFRRLGEPRDVPFVIRETARKFQHTLSHLSVWEKIN